MKAKSDFMQRAKQKHKRTNYRRTPIEQQTDANIYKACIRKKTTKQSKNLTNLVPCILWQKNKKQSQRNKNQTIELIAKAQDLSGEHRYE